MSTLEDRIFSISSTEDFERVALDVFRFQYANIPVYKEFVDHLNCASPSCVKEIPFLPISFFKTHTIRINKPSTTVFKSSGTGGQRSTHEVVNTDLYERSFNATYDAQIGSPENQVILALLPNYLEQGESSLVYMVDHLIQRTKHSLSGFFLKDHQALLDAYNKAIQEGKQVVIFGVSYALLDLCELQPDLSQAIIIETGGMKGRRKELTKMELHEQLKAGLCCNQISSEYGMTELLSQAYSTSDGLFSTPPWMKLLLRQTNDPLAYAQTGKTGGINIIDLANLYSCSFIATQDLGKIHGNQFEIVGRFDQSDVRGCNLLVQ